MKRLRSGREIAMRIWIASLAAALLGLLAATAAHAQPAGFNPHAYAEARFARLFTASGRYMEMGGACSEPNLNYPGYAGLPVLHCTYKARGVTADVWMLNADAPRLAKWAVSACTAIQTRAMRPCLDKVVDRIWGASNGQFPIAGYVVQPGREVGASAAGDTPYCSLVRHGVTVSVRGFRTRPARGGACGSLDLIDDPIQVAGQFARPASVTRANLRAAGVTEDLSGVRFADVSARLYREAWNAEANTLITAWALAAKASGALR
jgi:hypothetical protein